MKKFKLDPVLNYRRTLENIECRKLSELQAEKRELLRSLDEICQKLEIDCENLERRRNDGIVHQELVLLENNVQHQAEICGKLKAKLQDNEKKVVKQENLLKEACRNKKLLEKLKEKFITKERELLQAKEQSELDEVAVFFHKR